MRLSKLYSNQHDFFRPLSFRAGLNVVHAEIRVPENRKRTTHNLGKSTLGRLIDFCLLVVPNKPEDLFLFKHIELFGNFVFFLEIELEDGSYVTVRRAVSPASRIAFKRHARGGEDFGELDVKQWDHNDIPIDRAVALLDGLLNLRDVAPWSYRTGLGYHLRSQDDYSSVFQLKRHRGKDAEWKPFLGHILGFHSELITGHYGKEETIQEEEHNEHLLKKELGGEVQDLNKIAGLLVLARKEESDKQEILDAFDFRAVDKENTKIIVEDFDKRIAHLNGQRYTLTAKRKKLRDSLDDESVLFDPSEASKLFNEAGIVFEGQVKRDFEELIRFNKAITVERKTYLEEDLKEIAEELKTVSEQINGLSKRRSQSLSFLTETDVLSKYKLLSNELATLKANIALLERQRDVLAKLQGMRKRIRALKTEHMELQASVEADVSDQNTNPQSFFSAVRLYFREIVNDVLGENGLLSVTTNTRGHLEFGAEIVSQDGKATSAAKGHTYRKLLCIAFDLAIIRAHLATLFPRFAYHDGAFEALDTRMKLNLIDVSRVYADLGVQQIITVIDSDLPKLPDGEGRVFTDEEIILTLHDEGDDGRLFMMPAW